MPIPFLAVPVLPLVFKFLKEIPLKVWLLIIAILFSLSVYWYINHLREMISDKDVEITSLKYETKILTTERDSLRLNLDAQKLAIDGWKLAGDNLVNELAKTTKKNSQDKAKYELELAKLRGEKVPEKCPDALTWHSNQLRAIELKWDTSLTQ